LQRQRLQHCAHGAKAGIGEDEELAERTSPANSGWIESTSRNKALSPLASPEISRQSCAAAGMADARSIAAPIAETSLSKLRTPYTPNKQIGPRCRAWQGCCAGIFRCRAIAASN
tara:strand:+ start:588 stop:932 length:345 start_codon:yes stop_codon:yes gene_type:complete